MLDFRTNKRRYFELFENLKGQVIGKTLGLGPTFLKILSCIYLIHTHFRAVVSGGAGGALTPPEFGSSVNPIPTR